MSSTLAGWLQFLLLFAALAACYVPLGNYIARVFSAPGHWRVERGIYRLVGVDWLFWAVGMANVPTDTAWNTAASFVTNTNWQNYAGEATMSYLSQTAGLMVQQFLSAAVGLAVAIAMIRGFTRSRTDRLGNFWVDVTRGTIRLLIPLAVIGTLVLVAGGVIENLASYHTIATLAGGHQTIPGGTVASQEVIKDLGNNGG